MRATNFSLEIMNNHKNDFLSILKFLKVSFFGTFDSKFVINV